MITASLPSRQHLLVEQMSGFWLQPLAVTQLVGVDYAREGTGRVKTRLARAVWDDVEWIASFDDDDLPYGPDGAFMQVHTAAADDRCDVVWSWCAVLGREAWTPNVPPDTPIEQLRYGNFIPANAWIRASLVRELGGWRDSSECAHGWEDWDFWLRALDAGARFRMIPKMAWTYRFHAGCKTFHGEQGAT